MSSTCSHFVDEKSIHLSKIPLVVFKHLRKAHLLLNFLVCRKRVQLYWLCINRSNTKAFNFKQITFPSRSPPTIKSQSKYRILIQRFWDGKDSSIDIRERSCDFHQKHMLLVLCCNHSLPRTWGEPCSLWNWPRSQRKGDGEGSYQTRVQLAPCASCVHRRQACGVHEWGYDSPPKWLPHPTPETLSVTVLNKLQSLDLWTQLSEEIMLARHWWAIVLYWTRLCSLCYVLLVL